MRYICINCDAGGSDGRTDAGQKLHPVSYHCHECKARSSMWPEPIYTEHKRIIATKEAAFAEQVKAIHKSYDPFFEKF